MTGRPGKQRASYRLGGARIAAFTAIIIAGVTMAVVSIAGLPDIQNRFQPEIGALSSLGMRADPAPAAKSPMNVVAATPKPTNAPVSKPAPRHTGAQVAAVVQTPPKPDVMTVRVRKGDTLMKTLTRAGARRGEAHEAITALGRNFNPRRLKVGQEIKLAFKTRKTSKERLLSVRIATDAEREVVALRRDSGFVFEEIKHQLDLGYVRAEGVIKDSLFLAARRAGVPVGVLMELIRIYSWDVDFQRDIQRNDRFEVFFARFKDAGGRPVKDGEVLHAALTLSGTRIDFYRHELKGGNVDYFSTKGQSARKALLRTPINGARLSSRYGKRRHPILGYTKMHRGLDFAAPRGTPIMAGGDGVVERAGRNGAYGKYIRIRHNAEYKTAYGHLKSYARGVRSGKQVRQGQIIGYVGSTGRSTGPHLHYEVLRKGRQINPLRLKLPTGAKLKGKALARFQLVRKKIDLARADTPVSTKLAHND